VHAVELKVLDQVEIEVGKVGRTIEPRRIIRRAEAGMLRRDDVETLRQRVEERQPADMAAGRRAGR
jgi:hypothetical protein